MLSYFRMLDIQIKRARICDGTGNPWYAADVGIKDGRIAAIGAVKDRARETIDARGLVLCPGFVDVHTHADSIVEHPAADNVLRQGVTTVISGNCGGSKLPIQEMLDEIETAQPAINYATLVGHGTVRRRVMGAAARKPTRKELSEMRRLVDRAMREGAVGISTGLFYVPGAYAAIDEIVAVSEPVAAWGGVYASHQRSAAGKLLEAIAESASVGKRARLPIEISHLKILHKKGRTTGDRAERVVGTIERYRQEGVDLTYDVYPYAASSTSLASVAIPPWVSKDGKLTERLQDNAIRKRIRNDVARNVAWMSGAENITITRFKPDDSFEGRSLADIARMRRQNAATTAMDLIVEGSPSCIFHAMRAEDVRVIMCSPNGMVGSDGGIVVSRRRAVHPRNYGTFPRVLRLYVREQGLLSIEEAIRKMTSLPARKFGLLDRGIIALGMRADLVLFDPKRIADRATFERPHAFPVGVRRVIVNGHVAWDGRSISTHRAGMVIRKT